MSIRKNTSPQKPRTESSEYRYLSSYEMELKEGDVLKEPVDFSFAASAESAPAHASASAPSSPSSDSETSSPAAASAARKTRPVGRTAVPAKPRKTFWGRMASRRRRRILKRQEKRRNTLPVLNIGLFKPIEGLNIGAIDLPFFLLLLAVSAVGLITLFSASYTAGYYKFGDPYHYIRSQVIYSVIGICGAFVISKIPYQKLHRLVIPILAIAFILLAAVPFIGTALNTEAKRWLRLGPVTFQPSEVAKAALIISFSSICVRRRDKIRHPLTLVYFFLILGGMAALLLKEPHLSATIIIIVTGFAIMFSGGCHIGYLSSILAIGTAGLTYMVLGPMHYQYDRIQTWLDPFADPLGESYQFLQSMYAVASGGLWGLGLGQSRQKQMYLPEAYNDFVFSVACEELGFLGATLIIVLLALFVIRGFYIALRSHDTFGTLLVVGFMTQFSVQIFLNIGVVTGLLPITGASLPFFSSGGTSALMLYGQMGIVLSVSRQMVSRK